MRVRVRLRAGEREVVAAALANSGYEAEEPEVVVPVRVAERLSLYPELPRGARVEEYVAVGGARVRAFRVEMGVEVAVLAGDREVGPVRATVVIVPGEDEVVLSDRALDALRIVLVRPGKGIWRFTDDPLGVERASEPLEVW